MNPLLLHLSVAVVTAAIISLGLVVAEYGRKDYKVTLPVSRSQNDEYAGVEVDGQEFLNSIRDPFDIIEPEDMINGEPVNEPDPWREIKLDKIALLTVPLMLLIDHSVSLGYTLTTHASSPIRSILPSILHVILAGYLISLTSFSLTATTVDEHWSTVVHITSLCLLSTIAQTISVLLPNDGTVQIPQDSYSSVSFGQQLVTQRGQLSGEGDTYVFWYASVLLSAIAMAIAGTMPLGPRLYFPPERVYTLKSIEIAAKERGEDPATALPTTKKPVENVNEVVGSSCYGALLFDYSTKVVMLCYTSISLETADLPILPAHIRATTVFANMRKRLYALRANPAPRTTSAGFKWAIHEINLRLPFASTLVWVFPSLKRHLPSITGTRTITPFRSISGSSGRPLWINLLMQIVKANKKPLLLEVVLTVCAAIAFYAPAFFLRKLIMWLENDPRRTGGKEANGLMSWLTVPGEGVDRLSVVSVSQGWA